MTKNENDMKEKLEENELMDEMEAEKATIQGTIFLEEIKNELTRSTGATA